ncbi:MAG: AAA-like domain-containing protein [Trichodesmium sp. MAG_R01]|nr:AAA-like domain-containing protein [Trichodesmium sp. MAG_R01]
MNLEQIKYILNKQLLDLKNNCLNEAESLVLQGVWQKKTYHEIAQKESYSSYYIANVVAPELYRKIFEVIGKRVTKKNCRAMLELYCTAQNQLTPELENLPPNFQPFNLLSYPSGAIPLNSPFYLKQLSLEQQIIKEVSKPGGLVRIKAPQEMGKTSLLLRVLNNCKKNLGYETVNLSLQKADKKIFRNINQFLRWLCINCARKLGLKPNLDLYWDEDLGSKMSWTIYFEEYLLEEIDSPLVLALDELNQVFEHRKVSEDFLPLLRSCYEEAKKSIIWQDFRLIVVHNTEIYIPLQLEQSPFNIGLPIELEFFSQEEVEQLVTKYQLNSQDNEEIQQLMELVRGHPALIHLALYHVSHKKITFKELLATSASQTGIYGHHLQRHWLALKENPELANAFQKVCHSAEPVFLDPIIAYKLNSMGLINLFNNKATVSCPLYKEYFQIVYNNGMKTLT